MMMMMRQVQTFSSPSPPHTDPSPAIRSSTTILQTVNITADGMRKMGAEMDLTDLFVLCFMIVDHWSLISVSSPRHHQHATETQKLICFNITTTTTAVVLLMLQSDVET